MGRNTFAFLHRAYVQIPFRFVYFSFWGGVGLTYLRLVSNCYTAGHDLEPLIFLPPPPGCQDFRCVPPHLFYGVLGLNLGLCACQVSILPTELYPGPSIWILCFLGHSWPENLWQQGILRPRDVPLGLCSQPLHTDCVVRITPPYSSGSLLQDGHKQVNKDALGWTDEAPEFQTFGYFSQYVCTWPTSVKRLFRGTAH